MTPRSSRLRRCVVDVFARFSVRLFAASALVLVSVGALSRPACGAIIYSGIVDIAIPVTTDGVYLNIVTGQHSVTEFTGYHINPWSTTTIAFFSPGGSQHGFVRSQGLANFLVDNLAPGEIVGPAETSYGNGGPEINGSTAFATNALNYIGFRFLNQNTGTVNYGWARIALGPSFIHASRRIVDYAYENSGRQISVGSVPEPSSLSLLALSTIALLRRKSSVANY